MNSGNDWTGEGIDWATFSPNDPEFDPYEDPANFKYSILPDAIKLGFWDNFDEEVDTGVALNDRLADFWEDGNDFNVFDVKDWDAFHGISKVPTYKLHQGASDPFGSYIITDLGDRDNPQPYLTFSYFGVRIEITDGASGTVDDYPWGTGPEGPQDGTIAPAPDFNSAWTDAEKNCFCKGCDSNCATGCGNYHKYGWVDYYPKPGVKWGYIADHEDELSPDNVGMVVIRRRFSRDGGGAADGQFEHPGYYCFSARSRPNPVCGNVESGAGNPSIGTRYYARIYKDSDMCWEDWHEGIPYHNTKDHYIVVTKNNNINNNENFYFYLRNKNDTSFYTVNFNNHWGPGPAIPINVDTYDNFHREGLIGVRGELHSGDPPVWQGYKDTAPNHTKIYVDNIRIIPASPDPLALETNPGSTDPLVNGSAYYTADHINDAMPTSNVEWGTIWGAVNITENGDPNYDKVLFQTSTNGGISWDPAGDTIEVGAGIQSGNSNNIIYRAVFQTKDNGLDYNVPPYYSETVALEDVFITYLPETKVLYWSEVGS